MSISSKDERSAERRKRDERIAAEPRLSPPKLPPEAAGLPVESFLARTSRRPLAVEGVVENGLVRPLDPTVTLPESARVIIVATQPT
jgi:hypothetical protein